MAKHRAKAEARGLNPTTKRAKRKRPTTAEEKQERAEKDERKLSRDVFESTLMMMPFIADERAKNGKVLRRDWWTVKETGNLSLDYALGEKLGAEFLRYGKKRGENGLLISVINGMIEKGPDYCKHVRFGFLCALCGVMPDGYDFDPEEKKMILLR